MKVGILTFHRAENFGALLQAYALNKYIDTEICESEIIDFVPNNNCSQRNIIVQWILHNGKKIITFPFTKNERTKSNKFRKFRKRLKTSKKTYNGDVELYDYPPMYDVLISGSDQILNISLSGYSKSYYLGFDYEMRKISYASSFGRTDLSNEVYKLIKTELSKFSYLSAREQTAANIISMEIDRSVELVVDPVFLLSKDEWRLIAPKNVVLPSQYIFVYAMEKTEWFISAIESIKLIYNLPIISVYGGGGKADGLPKNIDLTCGPTEFLNYINNAEIVVTNSFHGTALSIVFGKKFICASHSSLNARLENIMSLVKNYEKLLKGPIGTEEVEGYVVDGKAAYEHMIPIIKSSKRYLMNSIICERN